MFDRVRKWVHEVRIGLAFPQYEARCRERHSRETERRFPVRNLSTELKTLTQTVQQETDDRFRVVLDRLKRERGTTETDIGLAQHDLGYFERNYAAEFAALRQAMARLYPAKQDLHERMRQLAAKRAAASKAKSHALRELHKAQGSIHSWHAESKRSSWLFGNARRELPRYSLFGQSLNELDRYKAARDAAHEDVRSQGDEVAKLSGSISHCYSEIQTIKHEIDERKAELRKVHEAQHRKRMLEHKGINRRALQRRLVELNKHLERQASNLKKIQAERESFIQERKRHHGVVELEERIEDMKNEAAAYLVEFDLEVNSRARRKRHRAVWIRKKELRTHN